MIDEGMVIDFHQWLVDTVEGRRVAAKKYHEDGNNERHYMATVQGATVGAVLAKFEEMMSWKM